MIRVTGLSWTKSYPDCSGVYCMNWEENSQMSPKSLNLIINRLINNLKRDVLIQRQLYDIREHLDVDRIVLYYFYRKWKGQVIAESLKSQDLSILGSTGAEDCFNQEYG
ncbi:MAG: hypothetical protein ACRCT1_20295, partial [Microcoleaceae cyanobacterium]